MCETVCNWEIRVIISPYLADVKSRILNEGQDILCSCFALHAKETPYGRVKGLKFPLPVASCVTLLGMEDKLTRVEDASLKTVVYVSMDV